MAMDNGIGRTNVNTYICKQRRKHHESLSEMGRNQFNFQKYWGTKLFCLFASTYTKYNELNVLFVEQLV